MSTVLETALTGWHGHVLSHPEDPPRMFWTLSWHNAAPISMHSQAIPALVNPAQHTWFSDRPTPP